MIADVNIAMCGIDGGIVHYIGMTLFLAPIAFAILFLLKRRYKAAVWCGIAWIGFLALNYIYKFYIFQCEP